MKSFLTLTLLFLLATITATAASLTPLEQAHKLKPGSKIEVTLLKGEKLAARLGNVTDTTIELLPREKSTLAVRTVSFTDVQQVRSKERRTGTRVLIYTGAIVGGLLIFSGILAAAGCC